MNWNKNDKVKTKSEEWKGNRNTYQSKTRNKKLEIDNSNEVSEK